MRTGGKPGAGSNAHTKKNTSRRAPPGGVKHNREAKAIAEFQSISAAMSVWT